MHLEESFESGNIHDWSRRYYIGLKKGLAIEQKHSSIMTSDPHILTTIIICSVRCDRSHNSSQQSLVYGVIARVCRSHCSSVSDGKAPEPAPFDAWPD